MRERAAEWESRGESPWAAAFFQPQDPDRALKGGELDIEFDSAELARCLKEDVRARVTGRFPKLRRLVLASSSDRMAPIRIDV